MIPFVNAVGQSQHRDLKLANCMFEDTSAMPIVKIIDFGLCAEFKDGHTSSAFVGTMTYAAPEVRTDSDSGNRSAVQYHITAAFPFSNAVSQYSIIVQHNAAAACSSAVLQHYNTAAERSSIAVTAVLQ